jgi:glycine/D-amino acid oxidase-like deaminating enzyme
MSDIATTPLWTEGVALPAAAQRKLPVSVDVLIVGAGYTGLSAARETAGAGRSTLVLDAAPVGAGCSSRNGGRVAYSIKPSLAVLRSRDAECQPRGLEQRISVFSRAQQRAEIATDFYHGGCVYHDDASVDPMRLLIALYRRAEACRV